MKKKPLGWLLRQIRPRIPAIAIMTLGQIINALFHVFFALGSRQVIDSAVSGNGQLFWRACGQQTVIILVILASMILTRHMKERLSADLERDWKKNLLHGLLHGEYMEVSGYHSAELLNRMNNDVARVNDGVLSIVPGMASMVTRLVAAVTVLGILDGRFTLLILLVGSVLIAVTAVMRRFLKNLNKQVQEYDGKVSGFLQETLEKLLMVQALDAANEVETRAAKLLGQRYELQRKRKNVSLAVQGGSSILAYAAWFLALVWCGFRMLKGQMSFGSLTAVLQLVNQLQTPFVNMSGIFPKYVATIASTERLMELDAIRGEPAACVEEPEKLYEQLHSIRAEGITFSYDRDVILHDASFRVPKGAFAAITGSSGIGKSTLLKLMLGLFPAQTGRLVLCGTEGEKQLDRSTRRMFAYVPQGNLLLSGTLRENLTIVNPRATQEDVERAVYISAMDEFLPSLPQGLDTVLGESGAGLSEGQAQRLAIARAVLGGAPILLLDEATSALDAHTEQKVLQRLKTLPNRTCIVVTHRQAALEECQLQLNIRDGEIQSIENNM